ncbi:hypothetical protein GCM10010387_15790 [Streptomyces inusitatus]|uniref:Uncharacterized protein n=2 Tax=Streptomyces inusitatus TaxID=68221 RepID=A0A918PWX7_9ACTN|nr:hypothetical protein GCM10010387_15790 [Streptomyces inusitatus]
MPATTTPVLTALAVGTEVATIGTFHLAEVVSSEITERGNRKTILRWTESIPAASVIKNAETVWAQVPGRTPQSIVTTRN